MARHEPTLAGSSQRCAGGHHPPGVMRSTRSRTDGRRVTGDQHYDVDRHRHRRGRRDARPTGWRPSGKRVLLLERGDYLPRERDNWDSTAVFVARQVPRAGVLVRPARRRVPARGQLLRRRQHQVLRRGAVPAAAGGLRRAPPPRRHLAGLADRLRRPRAVLHRRPSTSTWCTAGTARTRPRGRPARQYRVSRRSSTSRGSSSCSDDLEKQGLHPFHLPIGVDLTQDDARAGATHDSVCIRCDRVDGFPCLVERASPTPRSSASTRRWSTTTSSWSPTPTCVRLETDATGRTVTSGRHRARRRLRRSRFSADVVVVACGAVNSAVLLLRSANDRAPARAGQQLRTWSAGTTCGTTTWR